MIIPVHIHIDAVTKALNEQGVPYYILQRGEQNSGVIMVKFWGQGGLFRLQTQQRDLDGDLQWVDVLPDAENPEADVDAYISRARNADPDLWVVEVERAENVFV